MSATSDPGIELDDAIVLLLGAPSKLKSLDGRINGVTRLEKLLFLLERETSANKWLTEDAEFEGHNFGPFSSKVYQAIDVLSAAQIVTDSAAAADTEEDTWELDNVIDESVDPYVTRNFELTPRGWRYFEVLKSRLPHQALDELSAFKDRFGSLPLRQLVRYVYQKPDYQEFLDRSLIKEDILG